MNLIVAKWELFSRYVYVFKNFFCCHLSEQGTSDGMKVLPGRNNMEEKGGTGMDVELVVVIVDPLLAIRVK